MSFLRHPWLIRAAQLAIGAVFVWAGLAKVGNLEVFATEIMHFEMIPDALANLLAMSLPWIELLAGVSLIAGIRARSGALLTLLMMIAFTVAVGQAWMRGLTVDCGCFGSADPQPVGLAKILQNLGFTALAWVASFRPNGSDAASSLPRREAA